MAKQKSDNGGSGGKLLDTWHYEYKGIADPETGDEDTKRPATVVPKKVAVELRLIKKFDGSDQPPLPVKEAYFVIVCNEADIHISGNDVETLRKVMWGKLDDRFAVKWEDYFLVSVDALAHYWFRDGDKGAGLQFTYGNIEKGIAYDGTLLMRKNEWRNGYKITPWPGEFKDNNGDVLACIPATGLNRDALKEFASRIDALRKKLADRLRPDVIMNTLTTMSSLALLPAPEPGTEEGQE